MVEREETEPLVFLEARESSRRRLPAKGSAVSIARGVCWQSLASRALRWEEDHVQKHSHRIQGLTRIISRCIYLMQPKTYALSPRMSLIIIIIIIIINLCKKYKIFFVFCVEFVLSD